MTWPQWNYAQQSRTHILWGIFYHWKHCSIVLYIGHWVRKISRIPPAMNVFLRYQREVYSSKCIILTHWGRNKMDVISQTTFWSAFSWMKMFEFRITFHWSLFLRVQLTIIQHWFRWWLGAVQATSHYLNQWWLDNRHIYASLGLN